MARIAVIANPVASQFTGGSHRDVMSVLSADHETEAIWPSSATEASQMAAEAASGGHDVVVAMGGDGMVHHVAQGVVGTQAALGIIPAGTTNVVARLLDIPTRPAKAARLIASSPQARAVGVATITVEHGATEATHHAVFACGIGLDAEVVARADQEPYRKYRFGSIHYMRTAVGVALGGFASRKAHVRASADDREETVSTAIVQFRDVYTYFGRLPLRLADSPPAPMTVLMFDRLRRSRVPQVGVDAFLGRNLAKVKGATVWEGVEELRLEADPPMAVQADGEGLGTTSAAIIRWSPDALRVVAGEAFGA